MFKIDKSSVEYLDANISFIVVKPPEHRSEGHTPAVQGSPTPVELPQTKRHQENEKEEAENLLVNARIDAARVLADANATAEQIRTEAYRAGYTEGRQEALRISEETVREYENAFAQLVAQTNAHLEELDKELEKNVLLLSFSIAKKIVNIQLEKNDIVFEQLLRRTIQLHQSGERFVIRLNPREFERFFAQGTEQLRSELKCAPFQVISDSAIAQGGLMLESSDGIYRTGIDAQFSKLKAALGVEGDDDD